MVMVNGSGQMVTFTRDSSSLVSDMAKERESTVTAQYTRANMSMTSRTAKVITLQWECYRHLQVDRRGTIRRRMERREVPWLRQEDSVGRDYL